MGVLPLHQQDECQAVELSFLDLIKRGEIAETAETDGDDDGGSSTKSLSSSGTTADAEDNDDDEAAAVLYQSASLPSPLPSSSKKVLELPPYWIYGALPTDKEYGRWIRSQLSAASEGDEKLSAPSPSTSSQCKQATNCKNCNPFQHIQNAIAEGFAKMTQHKNGSHHRHIGLQQPVLSGSGLELSLMTSS